MKRFGFILAAAFISASLVGCANHQNQMLTKAENTITTNQSYQNFQTSIGDGLSNAKTSISKNIPQPIKDAANNFKKEAPIVYHKAVDHLSKASKAAAKAMDENFNAIF